MFRDLPFGTFLREKFAAKDFSLNGWEIKVRQTPIDAAASN